MSEPEEFTRNLAAFVEGQASKADAARILKISRTDLYRYLDGTTAPRPRRQRDMLEKMRAAPRVPVGQPIEYISSLDVESVTSLRNMLVHLVTLIDLDAATRRGNEAKGRTHRTGRDRDGGR